MSIDKMACRVLFRHLSTQLLLYKTESQNAKEYNIGSRTNAGVNKSTGQEPKDGTCMENAVILA
jgi:hypothetical protein